MKTRKYPMLWALWVLPILGLAPVIPALSTFNEAAKPSLTGAWEAVIIDGKPVSETPDIRTVAIYASNYLMVSRFDAAKPEFLVSGGGAYEVDGNKLTLTMEFHTKDKASIGTEMVYEIKFDGEDMVTFTLVNNELSSTQTWKRIDNGEAPLTGAWQIRERMGRDGNMHEMRPGPRKTVKILSGTRFQWTAMNTETKEFFGCGGGTYTFEDGKYTENIEFFSRDNSRVGASLSFEGSVEGDDWNHSGKSSRGNPIKEIWHR